MSDKTTNNITQFIQNNTKELILFFSIMAVVLILGAFVGFSKGESDVTTELKRGNQLRSKIIEGYKIKDGLMEKVIKTNKIIIEEQAYQLNEYELKLTNLETKLKECRGDE
jgi:hypothetical protein